MSEAERIRSVVHALGAVPAQGTAGCSSGCCCPQAVYYIIFCDRVYTPNGACSSWDFGKETQDCPAGTKDP